jgi:hypothetical protein
MRARWAKTTPIPAQQTRRIFLHDVLHAQQRGIVAQAQHRTQRAVHVDDRARPHVRRRSRPAHRRGKVDGRRHLRRPPRPPKLAQTPQHIAARHRADARFVARMLAIDRRRRRQFFAAHLAQVARPSTNETSAPTTSGPRQTSGSSSAGDRSRPARRPLPRYDDTPAFATSGDKIAVRHQRRFIERFDQRVLIASAQQADAAIAPRSGNAPCLRPAPRDIQKNNTMPTAATSTSNTAPAWPTLGPAVIATPAAPMPQAAETQNRIWSGSSRPPLRGGEFLRDLSLARLLAGALDPDSGRGSRWGAVGKSIRHVCSPLQSFFWADGRVGGPYA